MITKSLDSLSASEMGSLVVCYQQVFAGEPWNEWMKCPRCDQQWGRAAKPELALLSFTHCGGEVVPVWSETTVANDLKEMLAKPQDTSLVALCDEKVIAFALGYGIIASDLEVHLGIEILATLGEFGVKQSDVVAYQDDLGVLEAYRQQGIARRLFAQRLNEFRRRGLSIGVVRTLESPPSVTYDWYTRLGYQVIARYVGGRVVMARSFEGLTI